MALRLVTHFNVLADVLPSLLAQAETVDEGAGAGAGRVSWMGREGQWYLCRHRDREVGCSRMVRSCLPPGLS